MGMGSREEQARGETWIAVDRDGFVARFESGASGRIPRGALAPPRREPLAEAIDLACVLRWLVGSHEEPVRPDFLVADRMVLVLGDAPAAPRAASYRDAALALDAFERDLSRFGAYVVRAEAPRVIATRDEVDTVSLLEILRHERVLHAIGLRDVRAIAAARLGDTDPRFTYRHDDARHARESTYGRAESPRVAPLHESEIAEPARAALGALRVPVSFAEEARIDVGELEAQPVGSPESDAASPHAKAPDVAPAAGLPVWMAWTGTLLVMSIVLAVLRALF